MKSLRGILAALLVLPFGVGVANAAKVEIEFSERIKGDLARIDVLEGRREEFFRDYRQEGSRQFRSRRTDRVFFQNTEFAHERLIPKLEDFSMTAVIEAMVEHNLSKISNHNPAHTVKVEIEDFDISAYSLARYSQGPTRMKGIVSLVDASGNTVRSERVVTALVPKWTSRRAYAGTEYAYLTESMNVRMGPMVASFLEKGMEKLYDGADVPGPIFIRR